MLGKGDCIKKAISGWLLAAGCELNNPSGLLRDLEIDCGGFAFASLDPFGSIERQAAAQGNTNDELGVASASS
jgi:hypothetical protein